ncbi:eukaryotic translation initiation factor eIF2A-domain-containing protein [Polychytrium aggregatum]|uniref:eukaryotic translation initiation factor eIF2A-domain-containing protein n=1 Tax=Polychytrium aggregatum TaxID=110093 RepID=UPI0022FEAF1F|nr:eukaryotic translation initiation factor eIF2A-domain-containing protein [Polychytrium aggregatum]KAI9208325.1 eukaryotic translation initiation factor eIF2A-domain-containing protein [Polychytrium aggregatum]
MSRSQPVTQFAYRSNTGLVVSNGPPENAPITGFSPSSETRSFLYSTDGRYLAWILDTGIQVSDANQGTLVQNIDLKNVIEIQFSPRGQFITTWERYNKTLDAETNPHKNVTIWDVATGAKLTGFTQKQQNAWKLEWTEDEAYCGIMVTGEVQFYDTSSFSKGIVSRLKIENIKDFSISPGKRSVVAVFIPEKNSQPASVRLYDVHSLAGQPLAQKTFFRADSIEFHWNQLGTHILVLARTDVDKTGQSYYGETSLYFLAIAGNYDCRVTLDKPGPIHDVCWSPNSKEFIVVYGIMPAKATLFDHRANSMYEFGMAPRNFVKFNAQGRLICIGGFGNLAGELDVWDRIGFKKLTTINATNSSSCQWSPDGRHIMTSTLYKRMKVDNGIKIWHHSGALVYKLDVKEMHQIGWKPAPPEFFPHRNALSPPPATQLAAAAPAKPVGVYRPPGARGGLGSPSLRRGEDGTLQAVNSARSVPGASTVPGAPSNDGKSHKRKEGFGTPSPAPSAPATPKPGAANADLEKRIKNLNKKLKQISEIKTKIAAGEKVELTQIQKVESEAGLMKELGELMSIAK